jgi:peptidoglycan/LPS O-acetylase OafA/YrhL
LNVAIVAACLSAPSLNAAGQVTSCLALFYVGGLAAMARQAVDVSRFKKAAEAVAWFAAAVVMPIVVYTLRDQLDRFDLPLFAGITPVLLFCLSRAIKLPQAVQGALVAAGNMTYSSYLLHFPIQLVIVLCFAAAGRPVPVYSGALFAVYLLTTLLLSYFTFRFFEAPAQRLIRGAFRKDDGLAREALRRASSV